MILTQIAIRAGGVNYFTGGTLSALDVYWTAFAHLLDPLPKEQNPMPRDFAPVRHRNWPPQSDEAKSLRSTRRNN